jgi:hypothetical protein
MNHAYSEAVILTRHYTPKDPKKKLGVYLYCLAGKMPNRPVVSYEYASAVGFELNKKYEVVINELEPHPVFGRQFRILNAGEWTQSALAARRDYGPAVVEDVTDSETFDSIGD